MTKRADKKPISYSEWVEMGIRLKKVQQCITSLHCDSNLQKHMTKAQMKGFETIENGITDIKCQLEETMFRDIGWQYEDTQDLLGVFYGENLNPLPEPKKKVTLP